MEQLLRDLPPEEITPVCDHIPPEPCRVCAAIIYRPLRGLENLNYKP